MKANIILYLSLKVLDSDYHTSMVPDVVMIETERHKQPQRQKDRDTHRDRKTKRQKDRET